MTRYNTTAATIFNKPHIPIIDLCADTAYFGDGHYIDHVFYDEPAPAFQAANVAGLLQSWLEDHPQVHHLSPNQKAEN